MAFDSTIFAAFVGVAGIAFAAGCGPSHEEKLQTELMYLLALQNKCDQAEREYQDAEANADAIRDVQLHLSMQKLADQKKKFWQQDQADIFKQRVRIANMFKER